MFVQEFVRIGIPLPSVVEVFERIVLPRFGELVQDAWRETGMPAPREPVPGAFGQRRDRVDGVAYSLSWPAMDPCPAVNADVEIAEVSPIESHLEFAGQSTHPLVQPWSAEDRRINRQCMVAVDHLLRSIATLIESSVRPVR